MAKLVLQDQSHFSRMEKTDFESGFQNLFGNVEPFSFLLLLQCDQIWQKFATLAKFYLWKHLRFISHLVKSKHTFANITGLIFIVTNGHIY